MFAGRVNYGTWEIKSCSPMSDYDKKMTKDAEVVSSAYGKSILFHLVSGAKIYMPVSNDCNPAIGQHINVDDIEVLVLAKAGEQDITKLRVVEHSSEEEKTNTDEPSAK